MKRPRRPKTKELNIIQSLTDKKLLGQFLDPATFSSWLTLLRAFFALKPEPGDMELYKTSTGRDEWPTHPASELFGICGVRSGKSYTISLLALYLSFFRKYTLAKGEKAYILIVSPTKKQSGIIKSYLSGFLYDHPLLKGHIVRETTEEIELDNNIVISTLASDFKSLRGFTGAAAIVDEGAYLSVEGSKPDVEVIRALRSRLINLQGPLIVIGSPYAKRGEMYKAYKKHYGRDGSDTLVWKSPSRVMNPTLSQKVIDKAMLEDPEAAKADYLAEFRSDISSYIDQTILESVIVPGRYELPPISTIKYRAFIDPAGGSGQDSMTLAIGHSEGGLQIIDAIREIRPPFSPENSIAEFSKLLKRYRIRSVTGDRFGGEWPRERLKKVGGISYLISDKSKSDLYREFLPLLNSGAVQLLDNPRMVKQFVNLERRTTRNGKDSIDHGPGQNDDICNVISGVCVMSSKVKRVGTWGGTSTDEHRRNINWKKTFPGISGPQDLRWIRH